MINKFLVSLFAISISLVGCNTEPKFEPPIDPYGLPYRVGNLDGHPVNLGQAFGYLEYNDEDIWKKKSFWERFKSKKNRDYHSVIASFGFDFRYPNNLLLVTYYKAPQSIKQLYNKENTETEKFSSPWVNVGVKAGKYYLSGLDGETSEQSIIKLEPSIIEGKSFYSDVVINTHETIYGLEKYAPHPKAIEKYGIEDIYAIHDLYVERDKQGKMLSYIFCDYHHNIQKCELNFNMLPELKVFLVVRFRKSQLKNWKGIKESTKTIMRQLINNQIK